jgi:hypothetical protein
VKVLVAVVVEILRRSVENVPFTKVRLAESTTPEAFS